MKDPILSKPKSGLAEPSKTELIFVWFAVATLRTLEICLQDHVVKRSGGPVGGGRGRERERERA